MSNRSKKIVPARKGSRQAAGNRKRFAAGQTSAPPLQFGAHGELTPKTIKQANLSAAEEERAWEMIEVQAAYLQILDTLSYPVDPDGHVHDLSALGPTKIAIAWTLALNGARFSGNKHIKKRDVPQAGPGAHTWVDVRAPDDPRDELRPEHRADNPNLPPDTRRLAAIRDHEPGQQLPAGWKHKPKVVYVDEPRKTTTVQDTVDWAEEEGLL